MGHFVHSPAAADKMSRPANYWPGANSLKSTPWANGMELAESSRRDMGSREEES
jgi:hypothetical protein